MHLTMVTQNGIFLKKFNKKIKYKKPVKLGYNSYSKLPKNDPI